jgi:restriction system protein
VSKGLPIGGVVISPTGKGDYVYGEVTGDYVYKADSYFPHQRSVIWSKDRIRSEDMSDLLRKACQRPLTSIDLNPYAVELDGLIGKRNLGTRISVNDVNVEDASRFALEEILEDFLVANWKHTVFAQGYEILKVEGELVGQQFPADTGRIDILAISHDEKEYLVLELKRGKASDVVVGQLLRYMGYIKREYCQDGKKVCGAIVAHKDDLGIRNALSMVDDVEFYKYEIDFKLHKS